MVDFITEDDLELRIMEEFEDLGYSLLNAYTKTNSSLKDGTHRQTKKQVVLPDVLLEYARKLNPSIPDALIVEEIQAIIKDDSLNSRLLKDKNYEYYQSLINGINIKFSLNDDEQIETLKLIDFEHPENNSFIAARQVWIAGEIGYRRPDIIVYINGLPLVWIELKKPSENVQLGYSKNLMDQKKDIPQLFFFNQLCIISNGHITKAGSYNSTFSHYFEWLKIEDEKEVIDRTKIHDEELSIQYLLKGLMPKAKVLDYIENFILYLNKDTKIVAKNHQFLGVNHAIEAFENREARNGKLGVFWHTQGSGKSFSMVMYVRKIRRKFAGNYTFLLVTDRNDLDSQLIKNFVRTGVVEDTNMVKPKSGLQLRALLKSNISMIFTTIQKFRYDKYKDFPLLSERKDIIVIVDEAHRTQYKNLAENMRKGIPNAQYIAFTGTPLLGSKQLTYDYFGNPVSEYTFNDSINDGATVPLFYTKKVPTVNLNNDLLNDEFLDIIDKEELTDEERKKLENKYRSSLNVMKRDDRLDEVAQYIVKHFPKRGFLGKGMVISVDKYATVMMYNKVQEHWKKRIRAINSELQQTHSQEEKEALLKEKTFMNSVEMAVVVSEESGEEEKFERFGLDITQHRKRYHQVDDEGRDIEEQFKDPEHPLQLVFVTAMWLTGFDAPSVSTLYLDKPMKSHTLMQAIARANRVYSDDKRGIKINGLIVDHVNIFHYMKKALKDYGGSHHEAELDLPVKQVDELIEMLILTQEEMIHFCASLNIDLMEIVNAKETFSKTCKAKAAVNTVVATDEQKAQFIIYTNLLKNIYDASCPEIFQYDWDNRIYKLVQYMSKMMGNLIQNERIEDAQVKVEELLDVSVDSENLFYIKEDLDADYNKTISLSEIDVESMIAKIQKSEYVNIELVELRNFIEQKLEAMLNKNETRVSFAQRYEKLVQGYNAGATANENYFEELKKFVKDLKKEDARASTEHLSEEELVLYDLLLKEKLTKEEEKQVKSAATQLYHSLMKENGKFLSVDWFKDEQPKQRVKNKIETVLDKALPDSYDKEVFQNKTETIFQFILNRAVSGRGYVGSV
ncbi:type I restriction endonuclease subunit R [Candidatus Enterococcus ikei]|uniref:Type I restriction enzyme endonuclease subunit n=1 Tax=Candidatus Enterococcus ikei TaxID=2815326 RepID=A0ABS3GWG1_9ENTE|nr:type I restriction endonuclease subunit R [Enterococcus sp. DIV0869a]MBO0439616.1 type I restriction endonuclease subunit R [Enterococcus sp. DIV0869a]